MKPEEAVRQKLRRLGLEVVDQKKIVCSTSSFPVELFSVEDILRELQDAVETLKIAGLGKNDVIRLRGIISCCKVFKEIVDFMDYRGLEAKLGICLNIAILSA
jgi:hypothetical protein